MADAVATITAGAMGSGKTYSLCRRIVDDILPFESGPLYTNLPLNIEAIADFLERKKKCSREEVFDRVKVIPREVLDSWRDGTNGPWNYFGENLTLEDGVIILDECDAFVGTAAEKHTKEQWKDWLSEVRKLGGRIEFLVQAYANVTGPINRFIEIRRYVSKTDMSRDPWFKILMGDWYELRAKFITGEYRFGVWVEEERLISATKYKVQHVVRYPLEARYFQFYQSYNDPIKTKGKGVGAKKYLFERMTRRELLVWFFTRNGFRIASRFAIVIVFFWFCFGGGVDMFLGSLQKTMKATVAVAQEKSKMKIDGISPVSQSIEVAPVAGTSPVGSETQAYYVGEAAGSGVVGQTLSVEIPEKYKGDAPAFFADQGEATVSVKASQVAEVVSKVEEQQVEIEQLWKKVDAQRGEFYLTGLTRGSAYFSDGGVYVQGDSFAGGEFVGLYISEIDYFRRRVRLSDGRWLFPGMRNRGGQTTGATAGIPGVISSLGSGEASK